MFVAAASKANFFDLLEIFATQLLAKKSIDFFSFAYSQEGPNSILASSLNLKREKFIL